ncbi:MAG: YhfC family intramembrane metalloprotease [Bacteroidales bacterium]|nr:YhfC family intramembrane metalloprotease [Bacteroidales bacterium]
MLTVPASTITIIVIDILIGLAIPACLYLYLRKKGAKTKNFWIGVLVMLLFAFVLESIVNALVSPLLFPGGLINIWKYAILGGLFAGLFEETGRFLAFKTVLRKSASTPKDALMYGAGHGGFEVFVILALTMIGNLFLSILVNHGATDLLTKSLQGEALSNIQDAFYLLCTTESSQYLVPVIERISAIIAQLAFSVIVWKAATSAKYIWLYPLAIVLHLILDAAAIICNSQFHLPILAIEAIVLAMALCYAGIAWMVYKKTQTAE